MSFTAEQLQELTEQAISAALAAGQIIDSYRQVEVQVHHKDTGTSAASQVVTEVDHKAQVGIIGVLEATCAPFDLAILAEESADNGLRQQKPAFWCIDPMDGTLAFINGTPGFAVSIALVAQNGKPLIGVVYDPVAQMLFHAITGQGAFRNAEPIQPAGLDPEQALILRTDPSFQQHAWFGQTRKELDLIAQSMGLNGAQIQFHPGAVSNACAVLETANACYFKYARPGNSGGSLWDYAATACLYKEAGAIAVDIYGQPLELNRIGSTFMNHRGLLYTSQRDMAKRIIAMNTRLEGL